MAADVNTPGTICDFLSQISLYRLYSFTKFPQTLLASMSQCDQCILIVILKKQETSKNKKPPQATPDLRLAVIQEQEL